MAVTARVIWLCACVRYWPDRGLVFECVTCFYCFFFFFFFQKTSLVGLALVHTAQKDGHPFILYFFLSLKKEIIKMKGAGVELYGTANDPRTANDPGPEMIPILDRK